MKGLKAQSVGKTENAHIKSFLHSKNVAEGKQMLKGKGVNLKGGNIYDLKTSNYFQIKMVLKLYIREKEIKLKTFQRKTSLKQRTQQNM